MGEKKKLAIVGATGYTGQELTRILAVHPSARISIMTSRQNTGEAYADLFPSFKGYDLPTLTQYDPARLRSVDLAFFCLPHAESMEAVGKAHDLGVKAVDLSADFRLRVKKVYEKWYGPHSRGDLLKKAVYGLPELYREKIKKAQLVANPGCYPTGVILGVAPLLSAGVAGPGRIIADMKSGVSGAGRKGTLALSFCEVNEAFRAYNLYAHRHGPEMEQELSAALGKKASVTFSPHLAPMNRGILGTIYLALTKKLSSSALREVLAEAYLDEPFVRVLPVGDLPCVSRVRGTNFVDLAVTASPDGKEAIVVTAIDNLVKGASGAAVQNMNLMLGLPETEGLLSPPLRP